VGFADLGAALAQALGVAAPRVRIGSNAAERSKGDARVRAVLEARPDLAPCEPHEALAGACDVLLFDGFAGNVALKAMEAAVELTLAAAAAEGAPADVLAAARRRVDWRARGGALLVGVPGTLVVGHGRSDAEAVHAAVKLARRIADGRRDRPDVP
jgi:glycerol-3-phosphate acyltransferase PlsX